jgi:hypothetical protein
MKIIISLSIIFLIFEIRNFIYPSKYDSELKRIKENIKNGLLSPSDKPFMVFNLLYFIWSIIGLFSDYSVPFIGLFVIGLISSRINKDISEKERITGRRVDAFFSAFILIIITYFFWF